MEIKKYEVNGKEFEFVCDSWETSRAWGHEVHLFYNNNEIVSNRVRYYNRTWECFRYQTCMLGAISKRKDEILEMHLDNYKYKNNISRFKKGEKEKEIEKYTTENEMYIALSELYDMVRGDR